MESFVNLLANDVWSDTDIKARLHAELRGVISDFAETELKRALFAKSELGRPLTEAETALLYLFATTEQRVAALGLQARADAALLLETLPVEAAQQRLAQPVVELHITSELGMPETTNADAVALDAAEREAAQAVVDAASPEALALCLLRNPATEEVAE